MTYVHHTDLKKKKKKKLGRIVNLLKYKNASGGTSIPNSVLCLNTDIILNCIFHNVVRRHQTFELMQ